MARQLVYFDAIDVVGRLRAADPANVRRIAQSIQEIGLQTPITVMEPEVDGDGFVLVAGLHRLEAMRSLGMESAECEVLDHDPDTAALWEIDENLARAELTDAQRAEHHARREAILVRRGEVNGKPGPARVSDNLSATRSYAVQTSDQLGVNRRTVERDLRRGKNIAPEVLADVAGTDLDKGVVLDELASTPKPEQRAKLAEIALRRQEAERARKDAETANRHTDRVISLTDAQRFAEWLLARTDLNELPTVISWLEGTKAKDVIAALRREAA